MRDRGSDYYLYTAGMRQMQCSEKEDDGSWDRVYGKRRQRQDGVSWNYFHADGLNGRQSSDVQRCNCLVEE